MSPLLILALTGFTVYLIKLQSKRILNFRLNRFACQYAEAVCTAYQKHGYIHQAFDEVDRRFAVIHPKLHTLYRNNVYFRSKVSRQVNLFCTNLYVIGAGLTPPEGSP